MWIKKNIRITNEILICVLKGVDFLKAPEWRICAQSATNTVKNDSAPTRSTDDVDDQISMVQHIGAKRGVGESNPM